MALKMIRLNKVQTSVLKSGKLIMITWFFFCGKTHIQNFVWRQYEINLAAHGYLKERPGAQKCEKPVNSEAEDSRQCENFGRK